MKKELDNFEDFEDFEIEIQETEDEEEQSNIDDDQDEQEVTDYVTSFTKVLDSKASLEDKKKYLSEEIHKLEVLKEEYKQDKHRYQTCKYEMTTSEFMIYATSLYHKMCRNIMADKETEFDEYMGFKVTLPTHMKKNNQYIILRNGDNTAHIVKIEKDIIKKVNSQAVYLLVIKEYLNNLGKKEETFKKKLDRLYQIKL